MGSHRRESFNSWWKQAWRNTRRKAIAWWSQSRRKVWATAPVWVPVLGALVYWGVRTALEIARYMAAV